MLNQQLPAPHPEQLRLTDGTVVRKVPDTPKTLYCSRDGRFFSAHNAVLTDNGWQMQELKHTYNPGLQNHKGGSAYPNMRNFDHLLCHKAIALAWLGPRPAGMEIDHVNGDRTDYRADNLQYVTPDENRKRAKLLRAMRRVGTDPTTIPPERLKKIFATYTFISPEQQINEEINSTND